MKLADSGSGHVKTGNQVLVHPIQPPLPWQQHPKIFGQKKNKKHMKNDIFYHLTSLKIDCINHKHGIILNTQTLYN